MNPKHIQNKCVLISYALLKNSGIDLSPNEDHLASSILKILKDSIKKGVLEDPTYKIAKLLSTNDIDDFNKALNSILEKITQKEMGKIGGARTSTNKKKASRQNGLLGGRPPKNISSIETK